MQCLVAILAMENGKAARQRGLASLELKGVEVTEKEMSVGTFGQAVEVRYKGLRCVARKVTDRGKSEKRSGTDGVTAERLEEHCLLVSRLRHPHIVQFLGVYLERGSNLPVIVTEYLPTTLAKCLEGYGAFPGEVSYSVLRDVALGLAYLHGQSPPVVHGCLSPACVLLGWDMTAKIGDVGVARLQPESVSGRACGEAHDPKADLYCYGILMIHTLSGKPPTQISSSNTMTADKKSQYIHEYVEDHALSSLISQCINSSPQNRPEASQVLATVTEMMPQLSPSLLEPRLEILRSIHRGARGKRTSPQHSPRRTKSVSRRDKLVQSTELECLRLELDEMQIENRVLKNSIGKQKSVVSARDQEMAAKLMAKDQEIFSKQQELLAKEAALEGNAAMMEAKEATIQGLSKQLRHLQGCLKTRNEVSSSSVLNQGYVVQQEALYTDPDAVHVVVTILVRMVSYSCVAMYVLICLLPVRLTLYTLQLKEAETMY